MDIAVALQQLKHTDPLRITLSGEIGAGKSTLGKRLEQALSIPRIYIGQLMREEAARRNLTLDAFNALLEHDNGEIDKHMDALQHEKSKTVSRGIFEGRVAWHFVVDPKISIFLTVDPHVAVDRIWEDQSDLRQTYGSKEELLAANAQRKANEEKRYQTYYGISAYEKSHFDIVIDTSDLDEDAVFQAAVIAIAQHIKAVN